jgi:hypothetical protein
MHFGRLRRQEKKRIRRMHEIVTITHTIDYDGITPIVLVPLTNLDDTNVTLHEEDFDLLLSLALDFRWRLSANLVIAKGKFPVARIIADAKAGHKVLYRDGSPLNLKRSNLVIAQGGASKTDARELLKNRPAIFRRRKVELKHITNEPSYKQYNPYNNKPTTWELAEQLRKHN